MRCAWEPPRLLCFVYSKNLQQSSKNVKKYLIMIRKNPRRWGEDKKGRRGAGPEKCLKTLARKLSVAFHSVMRLAEHLAVIFAGRASLAPCGHVVGVHLAHLVNPLLVRSLALGAQRAVGDSLSFGIFRTNCLIFWGYI